MNFQAWKAKFLEITLEVSQYVKDHKKQAFVSVSIMALLLSCALFSNQIYQSKVVDVYYVYLHGTEIGTVSSPDIVEKWFEAKERTEAARFVDIELEIDKDVEFVHKKVYKGTYDNVAALDTLSNTIEVKAKAFKLVVNGEFIGYVKDQETGEAILDAIKDHYTDGMASAGKKRSATIANLSSDFEVPSNPSSKQNEFKEISILEEIKYEPAMISPDEIMPIEELHSYLQKGTLEERKYAVQKGDCLGCIAQKFDLRTKDLMQLNPGITEDTVLQIGQEINVTALKPKVTVQSIREKKQVEDIPFETKYEDDKGMYKGETKVAQKGVPGKKEVTYSIKEENGFVVESEILNVNVLSQPVTKIVRKGTKVPPSVGTGIFKWPTVGGKITSNYGKRWGRMHTGIDISGVKDKTIMAADAGKVTHVGTKGNYGKTIIIDHGNGYQTLYAHLSSYDVKEGQKVDKGQKIGVMGNTGRSTGTHLHFEIIKNGKKVNPADAFR